MGFIVLAIWNSITDFSMQHLCPEQICPEPFSSELSGQSRMPLQRPKPEIHLPVDTQRKLLLDGHGSKSPLTTTDVDVFTNGFSVVFVISVGLTLCTLSLKLVELGFIEGGRWPLSGTEFSGNTTLGTVVGLKMKSVDDSVSFWVESLVFSTGLSVRLWKLCLTKSSTGWPFLNAVLEGLVRDQQDPYYH